MSNPDATPAWLREIDRLSLSRTQIFLHGNVKDSFFYPVGDALEIGPLRDAVFSHFTGKGYAIVASYNLVDGMTFADPSMATLFDQAVGDAEKAQPKVLGKAPGPRRTEEPVVQALQQMRLCLANRKHACMFMVEQAPQLFASAGSLAMEERLAMLRVLRTSVESVRVASRQNTLIMVCDGLTEMPPWLVMNNPFVGSVEIDRPRRLERQRFFRSFFRTANVDPRLDELAELTEGMSTRELIGLRALSGQPDAPKEPKRLVDRFKFGQRESQWDSLKPEDLKDLEGTLSRRVIGQTAAVATVADVLRRARLHLSGAGGSSRNKPRGVLFFAGATGVGKTELAKAIAELVFGDDEMC
ncbi:MAG: ATP-dependent Clp protease ATP-binding subunit, partial [Acetobacteraceae bacterium]